VAICYSYHHFKRQYQPQYQAEKAVHSGPPFFFSSQKIKRAIGYLLKSIYTKIRRKLQCAKDGEGESM
jgi:hypothetical protein